MITRPKNFKFKSGDYLLLRVPKIAKFEWHPFTISSAPENKDELWLHIRSLGNWTRKLNEYFSQFDSSSTTSISTIANSQMKSLTNTGKKTLACNFIQSHFWYLIFISFQIFCFKLL